MSEKATWDIRPSPICRHYLTTTTEKIPSENCLTEHNQPTELSEMIAHCSSTVGIQQLMIKTLLCSILNTGARVIF